MATSVFITGGAGLIGQAVAKEHINTEDEVYIWDDQSNPYNDYDDLLGYDLSHLPLEMALLVARPEVVSHHAASVGVGRGQYQIENYFQNNLAFTGRLLEALRDHWMPRVLILAGSMAPYGEGPRFCASCEDSREVVIYIKQPRTTVEIFCPHCGAETDGLWILEADELHPVSMYGVTKLGQELMFRVFSEMGGAKVVSLRYFSVYGDDCNPNNPYTGVLSIIGNKLINSDDVELNEDGFQTRDLIHVSDVARAHEATARLCDAWDEKFLAMNIGTGRSVPISYVADAMIDRLKPTAYLRTNGLIRLGDIRDSWATIQLARTKLQWEPGIALETAIETYCRFLEENWDRFKGEDTCTEEDGRLKEYNLLK